MTTTTLSVQERHRLAELADALIPGADGMPAASEVDVHGRGAERVMALSPDLVAPVRRALAAGLPVEALRREDRAAFDALGALVGAAYLTEPWVQRLLGYPGRPALPAGYSHAELVALRELVRPVQARGIRAARAPTR
jgi:hypothetical protein